MAHRIWTPPRPSAIEVVAGAGAGAAGQAAAPVVRAALRSGLQTMFAERAEGSDVEAEPVAPGDEGWFGPGSVTWRVHADTSMFVGGIAALAFQALHPLAMAGVSDHSDFNIDPLGRLRRTASFVGVTAYGTTEQAEAACAMVRAVHDTVEGHTPDGRPYRANDPELLDWVHITEFGTFAAAQRRYGAEPISDVDLDRYVGEVARIAVELGDPTPPTTWAELDASLQHHRPMLAVGAQARRAMAFLEDPPLTGAARTLWPVLFRGAMACLPPWATALWGIDRPTMAERSACRAAVRALGALLGRPPGVQAATERVALSASA